MPTAGLLPGFRQRLNGLLWSLWSELGIPGWERRHRGWWIDPEALLLFTATVDPIDPRLRDEAIAWCLRHRRFLSTTRVRSLLRTHLYRNRSQYRPQLERFLVTASFAQSLGLDDTPQPYRLQPRPASVPGSLTRAALLSLRLRSLLGVTAKAEIIRVFLDRKGVSLTAADLAKAGVGYTKRATRDALEDLRLGGFVELEVSGNTSTYRLLAGSELSELVEPVPHRFPRWQQLLAVLRGVLDLEAGIGRFRPATRPIEIRRSLAALLPEIRGAELPPLSLDAGSDVADELEVWANTLYEALGSDSPGAAAMKND